MDKGLYYDDPKIDDCNYVRMSQVEFWACIRERGEMDWGIDFMIPAFVSFFFK